MTLKSPGGNAGEPGRLPKRGLSERTGALSWGLTVFLESGKQADGGQEGGPAGVPPRSCWRRQRAEGRGRSSAFPACPGQRTNTRSGKANRERSESGPGTHPPSAVYHRLFLETRHYRTGKVEFPFSSSSSLPASPSVLANCRTAMTSGGHGRAHCGKSSISGESFLLPGAVRGLQRRRQEFGRRREFERSLPQALTERHGTPHLSTWAPFTPALSLDPWR